MIDEIAALLKQFIDLIREAFGKEPLYRDPLPPAPKPKPKLKPVPKIQVTVIGKAPRGTSGFFSIAYWPAKKMVVAGTYNLPNKYSYLYSVWPKFEKLGKLAIRESIYDFHADGVWLYLATEGKGEVYRTPNGKDFQRLVKIGHGGAMSIEKFNGIYFATGTTHSSKQAWMRQSKTGKPGSWKVIRIGMKGNHDWVRPRDLHWYKGKYYIPCFNYKKEVGGFFTSVSGKSGHWSWKPQIKNVRLNRGCIHAGKMWIPGSPYKKGKRVPPAKVFVWDGKTLKNDFYTPTEAQGRHIFVHQGKLYLLTISKWRSKTGHAGLYVRRGAGTWEKLYSFPESEAHMGLSHNGHIWVVTRQQGGSGRGLGKVYRISGV